MEGLGLIIGIVIFAIGIAVMRAVFSINKFVGLLQVIAQELRARNMADGIYVKLDMNKENVKNLNHLLAWAYKEKPVEHPQ